MRGRYLIQQEVETVSGPEWRTALYKGKQAAFETEDEALAAFQDQTEYGKGRWRLIKIREVVLWTRNDT